MLELVGHGKGDQDRDDDPTEMQSKFNAEHAAKLDLCFHAYLPFTSDAGDIHDGFENSRSGVQLSRNGNAALKKWL